MAIKAMQDQRHLSSTEPVPCLHLSTSLQKQDIADFSQAVDDFNAYQIPKINQKFLIRHLLS